MSVRRLFLNLKESAPQLLPTLLSIIEGYVPLHCELCLIVGCSVKAPHMGPITKRDVHTECNCCRTVCTQCKRTICERCKRKCDEKSCELDALCQVCISSCKLCDNMYCARHLNLQLCRSCGRAACFNCLHTCMTCGDWSCVKCSDMRTCKNCSSRVCSKPTCAPRVVPLGPGCHLETCRECEKICTECDREEPCCFCCSSACLMCGTIQCNDCNQASWTCVTCPGGEGFYVASLCTSCGTLMRNNIELLNEIETLTCEEMQTKGFSNRSCDYCKIQRQVKRLKTT